MKKKRTFVPIPNDEKALQAARKANAIASSKELYAHARKVTGMDSVQRIAVMMAAKQQAKVADTAINKK